MEKHAKIYGAGAQTLIGAAILRELNHQGYNNIVGREGQEACLTDAAQVDAFFAQNTPEYFFLTAGRSGGIWANLKYPADLMLENLLVECNIIHAAYKYRVKKLLYLASSCCYPKHCPQPMKEGYLLTDLLEPTNEAYAVAKIAGIKLCQAYRKQYRVDFMCGIPANCFGPGDDFSLEDSHVIGALMHKMHDAKLQGLKQVTIWGTGKPRREFIYVGDLAIACVFAMDNYNDIEPINLGCGEDFSIAELAFMIKKLTGFQGKLIFDTSKPDGMPIKLLDSHKLQKLGWIPIWSFEKALAKTHAWFAENVDTD